MKKVRILSGLLVVVMVMLMMATSVLAEGGQTTVLSDVPYDYGIIPFSAKWENLTMEQRNMVFSIDKEIAKTLTTEALLKTILNNPYINDFFAYPNFSDAIENKNNQFQIKELLGRPDVSTIIIEYMDKYSDSQIVFQDKLKSLSLKTKDLNESDLNIAFNVVKYDFLDALLKYSLIPENEIIIESRYAPIIVYTKNYKKVQGYQGYTWEDWGRTANSAAASSLLYDTTHPLAGVVAEEDPSYNCHSFAWHVSNTNNNIWIHSAKTYLGEAEEISEDEVQVGTKVCYFASGAEDAECVHSGYVYELNSDGSIKTVISKWGYLDLMLHPLKHCPYEDDFIRYFNY